MKQKTIEWKFVLLAVCVCGAVVSCGKKEADVNVGEKDTAALVRTDTPVTGTNSTPASEQTPTMSDANILAKLSMSDSMEISMAKMAQSKAKSGDVKSYAKMMIDDHTKMMTEGKALSQKLAITPAPPPSDPDAPMMMQMMTSLDAASGEQFDAAYIGGMVGSHQKVLTNMQMMMSMAQNADLKAHIEKGMPVVQKHLDRAMELQGKMAGSTGARGGTGSTSGRGSGTGAGGTSMGDSGKAGKK